MPVAIFGLTDRGDIFSGAALTMILVVTTLALLLGLERADPLRRAAVGSIRLRPSGCTKLEMNT
jgi:ABC-type Fe3+ transport system permease subunit